jgi:hypothetical protein
MSSAPVKGLNSYSAAQAAEAAGNPVPEVDGQNNIGVEPNYSLERPLFPKAVIQSNRFRET